MIPSFEMVALCWLTAPHTKTFDYATGRLASLLSTNSVISFKYEVDHTDPNGPMLPTYFVIIPSEDLPGLQAICPSALKCSHCDLRRQLDIHILYFTKPYLS